MSAANGKFVSTREAARTLGVSPKVAPRVLMAGGVSRRCLPGMPPRWNAAELADLLKRSTIAAG